LPEEICINPDMLLYQDGVSNTISNEDPVGRWVAVTLSGRTSRTLAKPSEALLKTLGTFLDSNRHTEVQVQHHKHSGSPRIRH